MNIPWNISVLIVSMIFIIDISPILSTDDYSAEVDHMQYNPQGRFILKFASSGFDLTELNLFGNIKIKEKPIIPDLSEIINSSMSNEKKLLEIEEAIFNHFKRFIKFFKNLGY